MLRTHGAGNGSGGLGMGLRLNRTEGAQACLPPLISEGGGPYLGAQQSSWAQVGGAYSLLLLSCSSGPGDLLQPVSPDLPGLPPMPPGTTWPGVGFGGWGISLGA